MTREECIQKIRHIQKSMYTFIFEDGKSYKFWADDADKFYYYLDMIVKYLDEDVPKTGHWIPVSDRLPTKEEYIANNGLFIVSDGNRNYAEYFDIYDSKKFGELIVFGFRVDKCVIAWMPLPVEPYKAESEE